MTPEEKLDKQMRELYNTYKIHCEKTGQHPIDYIKFRHDVIEFASIQLARDQAKKVAEHLKEHLNHGDEVFFLAMRVDKVPEAKVTSVQDECTQCHSAVWIDINMVEEAKMSQIVCTKCSYEFTGKTHEELVNEALKRVEGDDD